ncbi:hypothetical protein [Actinomadura hibisca]|uniref:hypothetical protein n=1 Tax=Actinomadura hibisca TaxID=68565 RepID=UPI00082A369E|nr:hypothetical protein [Actinomadura hibisca]
MKIFERDRWARRAAALGLVVLSPLFAESLSGYDSTTGDPLALLGGLLLLGPLYGCVALLIREAARRLGVGWPGVVAMATAAGIVQAGVVDQSMFAMSYREVPYWDEMLRPTLIEPLGFAPYMATSFVVGHVVWSFCAPIVLVEALAGERGREPWLRWPGLLVAGLLYLAAAALILGDHLKHASDMASGRQVASAAGVALVLLVGGVVFGRRTGTRRDFAVPGPWIVGAAALGCAVGFNLMPSTWAGFAGCVALLVLAAAGVGLCSRSVRWGRRHMVALAGGAGLAMAVSAFFVTPLGDVGPVRQYTHNTVALLGVAALTAWAARRSDVGPVRYRADA